jgi:protein involved in polysaccharide export with SLBB domain
MINLLNPSACKISLLLLPLLALWLAGCGTTDYGPELAGPDSGGTNGVAAARLHVGDSVTVYVDGPPDPIAPHLEEIKDDGTISLLYIGPVKAAGKTIGELQTDIYNRYVPAYFTHGNVTVSVGDRVFYVRGEVKNPGRQIYVGQITVTKAITSAGDFTDFSNTKNVWLTRADGRRFKLNCDRILQGKAPDPGVYPGDQIEVERRLY